MLNEVVHKVCFADDATNVLTNVYADLCKKHVSVTAYAVAAYGLNRLACLIGLFLKHDLSECVSLLSGDEVCAVSLHFSDQLICNICKCENFLFCDAGKVVIKATAVDDILARFSDVSGIVNDNGGITCACADSLLSGGENCLYNAGAAGTYEKSYLGMALHNCRRLECGLIH